MYLDTSYCRYDAAAKHLYFTLPWAHRTFRVCSWSEGCRVEEEENDEWEAKVDAIDLPVVSELLTSGDGDHPISRYICELPHEVVQGIAPFGNGQLAMLQVCAASPRGAQLLRSAPVLLWLVAQELLRKSAAEPEKLHTLLGLKQRDLLALHCGRGNNSLIRLLAKLPIPAIYTEPQVLTAILTREEASSLLRHKNTVDWRLLKLIASQGDRVNIPLVRGIIMSDMAPPVMAEALGKLDIFVRDTTNLGCQLGIADADKLIAACTGWRMLLGLHEAWTKRLNNAQLDAMVQEYGEEFPPPPLPGMDGIHAIDSVRELLLEGRIMHNCVGAYINTVRDGTCYIYRVTEPERATLAIRPGASAPWVLAELKSYCNSRPGMDVVRRVQEWLSENNALILAEDL